MELLDLATDGQRTIVEKCLPGRQDRILIEVAQQDLAGLVNSDLFLRGDPRIARR